jgi:hypothetical protein
MTKREKEVTSKPIKAVFYNGKDKPIKTNRGKHVRSMMKNTFDHMEYQDYPGASTAEVFETVGGAVVHGVFTTEWVRGKPKVECILKRDPRKFPGPEWMQSKYKGER